MQYNKSFLHRVFLLKLTFLQKNLPIQQSLKPSGAYLFINEAITDSDNSLTPVWCQAII